MVCVSFLCLSPVRFNELVVCVSAVAACVLCMVRVVVVCNVFHEFVVRFSTFVVSESVV